MNQNELINKYNVPIPRYTSYPTVPFWDEGVPSSSRWADVVQQTFAMTNHKQGISLYIHLPYCERLCTYCACTKVITREHQKEEPYIEAVLKEWANYLALFDERPVLRELHLGGGTPTFFSPENLDRLLSTILSSVDRHKEYEYSFEGHPNNTTREHMQTLYNLGFRRISLGVQDFDQEVQRVINRKQTYEVVKSCTETAREIGYTSVNFDLIYGLPKQKIESVRDTIEKVKILSPDRIAFYSYAHVPWKEKGQRGFSDADIPNGDEKRELYELGKKMLTEIGFKDIGMDHFSKETDHLFIARENGTLHRNFMGYTTSQSKLLLGLGASSISDAGSAYVQNEKSISTYEKHMKESTSPYVRGHFLTDEDVVLKRAILDIACKGGLDYSDRLKDYFTVEMMQELTQMEKEGLLVQSDNGFTLTLIGLMFLRNVCAVFDGRLQRKRGGETMFSKSI